MAVLVDDWAAPLFVGLLIIAMMAAAVMWLRFQSRYGEARLAATTQFIYGARFEGEIVTGLAHVPRAPVRMHVHAQRGRVTPLSLLETIPPARMRIDGEGQVRIPFSLPVPDDAAARNSAGVRLYVRTRTWPIGWGATFLLVSP